MSESIFQQLSALLPAGCVRENVTLAALTGSGNADWL